MYSYTTKIRNREKKWVQMQGTGDALAIKRPTTLNNFIYIYIDSYQNFRVTANQKSTSDTPSNKKNQLKYNTKDSHQTTREENKRRKEEKTTTTKTNPKQRIKWQ